MNTLFNNEKLAVIACSASVDINAVHQVFNKIEDWNTACDNLISKGVAPLFLNLLERYPTLTKGSKGVPFEVFTRLRKVNQAMGRRHRQYVELTEEIVVALKEQNVMPVELVGADMAVMLYNTKPGLRTLDGIDLLLAEDEVETALEVFESLGFDLEQLTSDDTENKFKLDAQLPVLVRDFYRVRLHTQLHEPSGKYRLPEREILDRAVPCTISPYCFRMLEVHDWLLVMCVELDKQIYGLKPLKMGGFADIGRILTIYQEKLDWNILMDRSKAYGCERSFINHLWLSSNMFHAPLPANIIEDLDDWNASLYLKQLCSALEF